MRGLRVNPAALRTIRERSGLSVRRLAEEVGVQQAHLSNVEAGRRNPSPELAAALARALKVDLAALLADPDPAEAAS